MICTDSSRQVFRFKDEFGNVIKDTHAKRLTKMIAEPVKLKVNEHLERIEDMDPLFIDRAKEIARDIYKLPFDNLEFCKVMSQIAPNQTSNTIL